MGLNARAACLIIAKMSVKQTKRRLLKLALKLGGLFKGRRKGNTPRAR